MKRVMVIGSCGAGKSTFSRKLGEITGLPLVPLDRHYWGPGWTEPPKQEWERRVSDLIAGEEWIIDGNYGGTMEMRMRRADTVIWLDFPRHICSFRVFKRIIFYRKNGRSDMADGCEERFDLEFFKYVWRFRDVKNPQIRSRLDAENERINTFVLTSNRQMNAYLSKVSALSEYTN